jgi:hypothetical protein
VVPRTANVTAALASWRRPSSTTISATSAWNAGRHAPWPIPAIAQPASSSTSPPASVRAIAVPAEPAAATAPDQPTVARRG